MKIGIITFQFPWNCGALLQCTALQTTLEEMGHESCVINYRPLYHTNRYSTFKHPLFLAQQSMTPKKKGESLVPRLKRGIKAYYKTVKSWKGYKPRQDRALRFQSYTKRFIRLTKPYKSIDQLRENPPKLDMYVAGSDQLWNAKITCNAFDPAYFLDFGGSDVARITYSMGADFSAIEYPQSKLIKLIDKIDAISLREEKYMPTVKAACEYIHQDDKPLHIDLDPTFLLRSKDYERFESTTVHETEPYIFTYTMPDPTSQAKANKAALALSEKTGLRVIDASGNPNNGNRMIKDNRICGPDEFLSYIKGASYVVTSSFHGTAFALIYNKQFVALPHASTGNRITELLDKLGLSQRYASSEEDAVAAFDNEIDYDGCNRELDALRRESLAYLKKCINMFCCEK